MLIDPKFQVFWNLSKGFRILYLAAIIAMAVGYIFMFGVPLVAKFSIDAILTGGNPDAPDWLYHLASWSSLGSPPDMLNYLLLSALAMIGLTAVSGALLYLRSRCTAMA